MPMSVLSSLAIQAIVTLGTVDALPPEAAGRLVLAPREHGPIVAVEPERTRALQPPGYRERHFIERARRVARGCVRTRWMASFRATSASPDPVLHEIRPTPEVAALNSEDCPASGYATIAPGLSPDAGFDALAILGSLRSGRIVPATCDDSTASRLCDDAATMRSELSSIAPWHIQQQGDQMLIWLGMAGQTVTEIRYRPGDRPQIRLSRRIPAPA